jgi:hypothetical protein
VRTTALSIIPDDECVWDEEEEEDEEDTPTTPARLAVSMIEGIENKIRL